MITFITLMHLVLFSLWGKHIYNVKYKGKPFDVFTEQPNTFTFSLVLLSMCALVFWGLLFIKYCP